MTLLTFFVESVLLRYTRSMPTKAWSIHTKQSIHPLISPKERAAIVKRVQGMWKNRKPDPIKELRKMRREWERPIQKTSSSWLSLSRSTLALRASLVSSGNYIA